jgi:hypothetical protein
MQYTLITLKTLQRRFIRCSNKWAELDAVT